MLRKFDAVSKEVEKKCLEEIITRIEEIGDSRVGVITAQEIIDIVTQNLGPDIYNMGLMDAKKLLQERFSDLDIEIDLLKQRP